MADFNLLAKLLGTETGTGEFAAAESSASMSKGISATAKINKLFEDIITFNDLRFKRKVAGLQVKSIQQTAQEEVGLLRDKLLADISNSTAAFSARGISTSGGTPQALIEESARALGEDAKVIRRERKQQAITKMFEGKLAKVAERAQLTKIGTDVVTTGIKAFAGGI